MKKIICLILIFIAFKASAMMPLRLPSILSNHAVMQQSSEVKLWGWGCPTYKVRIICSWNSLDTLSTIIGADCSWEAKIHTPKASSKTYSIQIISGTDNITIEDILMGEVWLCSGQSNMELTLKSVRTDGDNVIETSDNNEIRFFEVKKDYEKYLKSNCEGEWKVCSPETVPLFSAVAYFFGHKLSERLKIPVGLIGAYWGGTSIQTWMPLQAYENDTILQRDNNQIMAFPWGPQAASLLFNTMINPLIQYPIAGVIWYQGETNVLNYTSSNYSRALKAMIGSWRKLFGSIFPFYFVQIAPFQGYGKLNSACLREQQEATLTLPKTGMISVGDLVNDINNIHPKNKSNVGYRLADLALYEQYHIGGIKPYHPRFASMSIHKDEVILKFKSYGKLSSKDKEVISFNLAGKDSIFYPAKAALTKEGSIVLSSPKVSSPIAVRYCFSNNEVPNLFDTNGLPLLPFRTDNY